jgi:hypothetical protein
MYSDTDIALVTHTGIHLPETLRFVSSEDGYSLYQDRDGNDVHLAHGTGQVLVGFWELDLRALWNEFIAARWAWSREDFLDHLRSLTYEPDDVEDEVTFCGDCSQPHHDDDMTSTRYNRVCESCLSEYWHCNDCEEYFSETTTTLDETEVCDRCRGRNWSYCDECDGWRRDEDSDEHDHGGRECTCESPKRHFFVRNDGEAPLENDTRTTVSLPAGVISSEGIEAIAQYLRDFTNTLPYGDEREHLWQLAYQLEDLGDKWQTREGNFTKRLSRFAYKTFGLKVAPEVISQVGCIAREHSTAVDFEIEVTRNLNLPREEFAHDGSCWWTDYATSRCSLKSNGGFGLRTFGEDRWGYKHVKGRAWVMPLRENEDTGRLVPTFETLEPDAFIVFNGYGDLQGYVAARIVSHMAGMTYRKVGFENDPMYVNNDTGYLVAREEIAERYTDGHLTLHTDYHSNLYHHEIQEPSYA